MRRIQTSLLWLCPLFCLLILAACDSGTTSSTTPTAIVASTPTPVPNAYSNLQLDPGAGLTGADELTVGTKAPDFNLPAVDGNMYSLSSQLGKVVVLEFIATWCPHCQNDAPMMNKIDANYKGKNVQLFAINAATQGYDAINPAKMSDLQWFHDNFKVTFPMLFDTKLKSANDYGVPGYPTIFIVDQKGVINFRSPDNQLPTYDMFAQPIDALLASGAR